MSEPTRDRVDDSELARLLRSAGRGPRLSDETRARIYAAVRERWSETLASTAHDDSAAAGSARPHSRSRTPLWLGLAATFAGLAVLLVELRAPSEPDEPFATVALLEGPATLERDGQRIQLGAEEPTLVRVGDRVSTDANARVALALTTGQSLRVNSNTMFAVADAAAIELDAGAVYFDSVQRGDSGFGVRTAFGVVRPVGTQYEVSSNAARLRVRVREGAAVVETGVRELETRSGEQLQISAEGDIGRAAFAPDDPGWRWVEELATVSPAAEHNLFEILLWLSRETGVTLQFDEPETEARARSVDVSGLAGFDPRETLEAIRTTTAFSYRSVDGRLVVAANPP